MKPRLVYRAIARRRIPVLVAAPVQLVLGLPGPLAVIAELDRMTPDPEPVTLRRAA